MTLLSLPGPVDPHVHLRDLDWSHKATARSETAAALAGGYWAVLDMPNTPPPTTSTARLRDKAQRFSRVAHCDFGLYLGADGPGAEAPYAAAAADAVGLKMYCDRTTGELLVDEPDEQGAHMRAWSAASRQPLAVHAEGATLAAVLALAEQTGTRVHFCHVSAADEIGLLRAAKRRGADISVGVTPHHLYLTADDVAGLGGRGRVLPALKSRSDVDALWAAVEDGTVDVIESDHAPHTRAEKDGPEAPAGMPGLETTLPLMALALSEGRITADRLIELVASNPQRIWGLAVPHETMTTIDTDATYEIRDDDLLCLPGWSPFSGMQVRGRVREVRIRGQVVYDGEQVLASVGNGRPVTWS